MPPQNTQSITPALTSISQSTEEKKRMSCPAYDYPASPPTRPAHGRVTSRQHQSSLLPLPITYALYRKRPAWPSRGDTRPGPGEICDYLPDRGDLIAASPALQAGRWPPPAPPRDQVRLLRGAAPLATGPPHEPPTSLVWRPVRRAGGPVFRHREPGHGLARMG